MSQRTERVDELLRQEIGAILAREVQDPRIGFATITDVETTPDLRHARVWVSVIGPEAQRAETVAALERAMGYVRHELGRRLRIKRIPELHVRLDDSAERGTRVLRLLSELEEGHVPDDLPEGETLPTPVRRIHRTGDAEEPREPAEASDRPTDGPEPSGTTGAQPATSRAGSAQVPGGTAGRRRVRPRPARTAPPAGPRPAGGKRRR